MARWNVHIINHSTGLSVRRFQVTASDWMEAEYKAMRGYSDMFFADLKKVTNPYNELYVC